MDIADQNDPLNPTGFEPDFATPVQWALMYRAAGLQVVPCRDKRPDLHQWVGLKDELAPAFTFERWYGTGGEHASNGNMGVITGPCSRNLLVVDLDTHTKPEAKLWWDVLIETEAGGIDLETPEQLTGGGGYQKLFLAPPGYRVPTIRTSIGVDIRGAGGFAVLPPTRHASGNHYAWLPGRAPWEITIEMAPQWLLDAIEMLAEAHGGGSVPHETSPSPGSDFTDFGQRQDGREPYMRSVVWAAVVDRYRDSPIKPPPAASMIMAKEAYEVYERSVTSRLEGAEKREGLEKEHRGPTAFYDKWRAAMRHWDGKVAEAAKRPKPAGSRGFDPNDFGQQTEPPKVDPATGQPLPLILTSKQFVAGFTPPEYLIDGIMQRGYLYSLTARTGHGKTAVAMYMAQAIARGEAMHGKGVLSGTVLLLAGENPDDIRARFMVLAEAFGFDPTQIKVRFIAGVVSIASSLPEIKAEAEKIADLVLVIVDTAAAYFPGDETNSNSQQGAYARLLRQLTFLPGKPAVLVNCHPVKNAAEDNLLPMGGSAFLNEVDGNLTLWSDANVVLHWQGKFRGPEFQPMAFELRVAQCPRVVDAAGRLMPSVVASPVAEATLEAGRRVLERDEDAVLEALGSNPDASQETIAIRVGFTIDGRANKAKVNRILKVLAEYKFVVKHRRGKYKLTTKGKAEIGLDSDD